MKILPTLSDVKKIADTGKYNVVPVSLEILSDFTTPVEIMKILKNVSTHCYMLESAQANETWGRYTFLRFEPKLELSCIGGEMTVGNLKLKTANTIVKIKPMTQARAAGIRITPSEIINQTIGNNAIANLIHIKILHHQKCCTIYLIMIWVKS